jgi:hypothetical protein
VKGPFQIEELLLQDAGGVIFDAIETATGCRVALRRFFPFGAEGGGLEGEEPSAYAAAVGRLAGLEHPGLRPIIAGGCDPVDGIPYLAAGAADGTALDLLTAQQPLAPADAVSLLARALEASAHLSAVLGEEAVWVETDPRTIIASGDADGMSFTFWISPLKWLGGDTCGRGLCSIVSLTEQVMHWQGQMVGDQTGQGLGGWLKWLRVAPTSTTLREALDALVAATGATSAAPPPLATLRPPPPAAPLRVKPRSEKSQLVAIGMLALAICGTGFWAFKQRAAATSAAATEIPSTPVETTRSAPLPASPPPARPRPATISTRPDEAASRASQRAEEISRQLASMETATETRRDQIRAAGDIFSPDDRDLLLQQSGMVAVRAVVRGVEASSTGKTLYLFLEQSPGEPEIAGAISTGTPAPGLSLAELRPLVGRTVTLRGKTRKEFQKRLLVMIDQREAIEAAD